MNTCSVREKAEDKVYSLLGEWRDAQEAQAACAHRRGRLRGEPGRRGHHQTRALRGPGVRSADPASPARHDRRAASAPAAPWSTCPSPRSRSSTTCRRRARKARAPTFPSWKAAASTARSAWCRTRAATKSVAVFDSVMDEVRSLAVAGRGRDHLARPERQRLRGRDGRRHGGRPRDAHPLRGRGGRRRSASASPLRTRWNSATASSRPTPTCRSSPTSCILQCSRARTGSLRP